MSKPIFYKQCEVQNGNTHEICFLPEKFAVVGGKIELKINDGWYGGWTIVAVYDWLVPECEAIERSVDYKKQRRCSDI